MREFTRAEMSQKFETELEEAKEVARYELEQEHLENLRQLEQSLGQKHAEQLRGLAELQQKHVQEINILKAGHVAEVERLKNELAQAHTDQLSAVSLDAEREVSQVTEECCFVTKNLAHRLTKSPGMRLSSLGNSEFFFFELTITFLNTS